MTKESNRLRELFDRALQFSDESERAEFIEEICHDNPELKAKLEKLIEAYFEAGSFLEAPPEVTNDRSPDSVPTANAQENLNTLSNGESEGNLLGPYLLKKKIGEGGYGVVYAAEQLRPVRRDVAVKLIKPGMDSREVIARFNLERQALAVMEHPYIATILDAGTANSGSPYFVMELVDGISITQYCDRYRLTLQQRLELFISVCHGVQHAHQKGVIHRDLKPGNILVTIQDSKPQPKIIDFGIAKAMDHMRSYKTQETGRWQLVGTPIYMSPEQAASKNKLIDARSDIYSLGVLLYELLTGQTPISSDELSDLSFTEFLEKIKTVDTPKPSSRLTPSNTHLDEIAKKRQVTPKRLRHLVAGDLDWIVVKALAREVDQRYESAGALARDIERFIDNDPIEAGPPSATYRLRKFVRKHWIGLTTAAAFAAVLITATTVSIIQAMNATHNASVAKAALDAESEALAEEEKRRKQYEEIYNFMMTTYEIQSPDSNKAWISIRDVQESRKQAAISSFDDNPSTKVNVMVAVAKSYNFLGLTDESEPLLMKALEICDEKLDAQGPEVTAVKIALTDCYLLKKNPQKVIQIASEELENSELLDDYQIYSFLKNLGLAHYISEQHDEAVPYLRDAVELAESLTPTNVQRTLQTGSFLARSYLMNGETDKAIDSMNQIWQLLKASDKYEVERSFSWLTDTARLFFEKGHVEIAESRASELLEIADRHYGKKHSNYGLCLIALAHFDTSQDRHRDAIKKRNQVIELSLSVNKQDFRTAVRQKALLSIDYSLSGFKKRALELGKEADALANKFLNVSDPNYIRAKQLYAVLLENQGQYVQALSPARSALRLAKKHLGESDNLTLECVSLVARLSVITGKSSTSIDNYEKLVELSEAKYGSSAPESMEAKLGLAQGYSEAGQPKKALELAKETYKVMREESGIDDPKTWQHAFVMAIAMADSGDVHSSIELLKEILENQLRIRDPEHLEVQMSLKEIGMALHRSGNIEDAPEYLRRALRLARKNWGDTHPQTILLMKNLAHNESQIGNVDGAIPLFLEIYDYHKATLGAESPTTQDSYQLLGQHYLKADRFDDAEQVYDGMFEWLRNRLGNRQERMIDPLAMTAQDFRRKDQFKVAHKYFEMAFEICKVKSPNSMKYYQLQGDSSIAMALEAMAFLESEPEKATKVFETAEERLLDTYNGFQELLKNAPKKEKDEITFVARQMLAQLYEIWGKPELAKEWNEKK